MYKKLTFIFLMFLSSTIYALETTPYGKIVGIETRAWGLHVQTDFSAGSKLNCPVSTGQTYMFDFILSRNVGNSKFIQSSLFAAFISGTPVSFHLYECNGARPIIDHVRLKN